MSCRFKGHTLDLLYAHEYTQGREPGNEAIQTLGYERLTEEQSEAFVRRSFVKRRLNLSATEAINMAVFEAPLQPARAFFLALK